MKMAANFILPLSLALLAMPVLAQESNVSGKGKPDGVSDQDYLIQRERILQRMKATSPQQSQQTPGQEGNPREDTAHDSTYGQGYRSRKADKDAAESKQAVEGSRPERPERPHIDHPGR
ncbi:MAG: hypothetical protein AWT59_2920 [Candidatus Gallionella acididurans]|uniref:Uncharacterized protein n=1 Tax=Candidatus Gallionella acididurans TaxID=1796491 RepID=A0A139BPM4_9PROT|nr:MAG: hypothetical protein AWT59_2920 [Candidatus Gallionella acididurans]